MPYRRELRRNASSASSRASCSFVKAISVTFDTGRNFVKESRSRPNAIAPSARLRTTLSFRLARSLALSAEKKKMGCVWTLCIRVYGEICGCPLESGAHVGPASKEAADVCLNYRVD